MVDFQAIAFDDFALEEAVTPTTNYTYSEIGSGYDPSNPSGVNESLSTLTVLDGTAVISSPTTLGTITVKPVAVLDPDADITANFVFESDNTGSGQLANTEGHSLTGTARVENFIPAQRAFRSIASSVSGVSVADSWQEQIHITGSNAGNVGEIDPTNGFDITQSGNPSMFEFDHSLSDQSSPWLPIPDTDHLLEAGNPYFLMIRGDRDAVNLNDNNSPSQDVTLSAEGTLYTGDFDVETSNTPGNFTLVGNPYQAVVDLNNLTYGADVNSTYAHYWDPHIGTYGDYVEITISNGDIDPSSSNADQFLRPGQAVFIRNSENPTGTDFSIQFSEEDIVTTGSQTTVFSTEGSLKYVNLRIYTTSRYNANQTEEDAMALRFTPNGNNQIDDNDATKMFNQGVNISSLNASNYLGIEHRDLPQDGEIIPLSINGVQSESYTFVIHAVNFEVNQNIALVDLYTNQYFDIDQGNNQIEFTADTSIPESIAEGRFQLVFTLEALGTNQQLFDSITIYPNPVESILHMNSIHASALTAELYDLLGNKLDQVAILEGETQRISFEGLSSGLYLLKLFDEHTMFYRKIIKK